MLPSLPEQVEGLNVVALVNVGVAFTVIENNAVSGLHGPTPSGSLVTNITVLFPAVAELNCVVQPLPEHEVEVNTPAPLITDQVALVAVVKAEVKVTGELVHVTLVPVILALAGFVQEQLIVKLNAVETHEVPCTRAYTV